MMGVLSGWGIVRVGFCQGGVLSWIHPYLVSHKSLIIELSIVLAICCHKCTSYIFFGLYIYSVS